MDAIKLFNGLNGSTVSREILLNHIALAKRQEQHHVAEKLERILLENSNHEFTFEIERPAIEIVPGSLLKCLDCEAYKDEETFGLAKPVSPNEIYDRITEMVIGMLDQDYDFEELWESDQTGYVYAYNFVSKKPYRGINQFLLGSKKTYDPKAPLLQNPYFLTFEQIKEKKGVLRKGSKGQMVIYYVRLYSYEQHEPKLQFSSYDKEKFTKWVNDNKGKINALKGQFAISINSLVQQSLIPILKYYNVFSGSDVDGIDFDLENFTGKGKIVAIEENNHEKIEIAELIIENYPNPKPKMAFGGDNAFFRPSQDLVQMPNVSQFKFIQAYYTIFFHELVHSTATPERLDRVTGKEFGDKEYAFEELTAELGAMFLCGESGILHYTKRNSAAYLKNWRTALLQELKNDNKFFFRASSQAQKAVDFMLDRDENGIAAYEKFISALQPKSEAIEPKKGKKKTKKPEYSRRRKYTPKPKVDKNGQYALLGVIEQPETIVKVPTGEDTEMTVVEEKKSDPVQPKVTVIDQRETANVKNLKNLGFVSAADVPDEPKDVFVLPGEIGKFIQKIQPHKALILIKGTKHTSKSQLTMQIANAFGEMGKPVAYIDYEQGGMESKDTVDSINRNTTVAGRKNILIKGHLENPFEELKKFCQYCGVIAADSVTDLGITADQLNDLRTGYPKVIWIFISQVKDNGEMYGGNKMAHNPTCIIKCHPNHDPKLRYATLEKNRGNNLELMYWIMDKKIKEPETTEAQIIEPEAEVKTTTTKFSFQT